jgi:hypothetical protein
MKFQILVIFYILSFQIFAQNSGAIPSNIRASNTLDRLSDGGLSSYELLIGIPVPPGELIGDVYLIDIWKKTTFSLLNGKLYEGFLCRYNIQTDQLEISGQAGISALSGSRIKSFVWMDESGSPSFYVNAQEFNIKGVEQKGFLNVLSDGKLPLLKKTIMVIKQPTYKPELHIGNRDTQIIKRDIYYYSTGNQLVEIKKRTNKRISEIFGDKLSVDKFIKDNSLTCSSDQDLIKIFDHYNSL